ncbi:hypothetical protein KY285_028888 [Solanum tuberosum]|nr:hypothetical protein KY285_028888 [Solanum tuberosum]
MERARKRRREDNEPGKPTSTPLPVGSSDTECDDVAAYMAKRRKEREDDRVKKNKIQKATKKSPVKKERVRNKVTGKSSPIKGPGTSVQNPVVDKEMTREDRIAQMENQKVLNNRVFDPDILTAFGMLNLFDIVSLQGWGHLFEPPAPYLHEPEVREFYYKMELLEDGGIRTTVKNVKILLDEETLGIILGVPMEGIRSIEGCHPSSGFSKQATNRGDIKRAGLPKKFLKGEYQLLFEFINKVLVPRTEKRTVAFVADLFLMEKLYER